VNVLFDTNVILDLLLDRKPFVDVVEKLIAHVEKSDMVGFLSATTVTTIYI